MKKFNRRRYLALLMQQGPDWVKSSLLNPTEHMPRKALIMHCIALRRMGEPIPSLWGLRGLLCLQ